MYTEPKLYAILSEPARDVVRTERHGRDRAHSSTLIGLTAVSIHAGEISSRIGWGINGFDIGISSDVAPHIDCFTVEDDVTEAVEGHYSLRNRSGQLLAEARVAKTIGGTKFDVYVRGKERVDVVKLFEQIRAGETAPESAGGRRGLIRELREEIRLRKEGSTFLGEENERLIRELGIQLDNGLRLTGEVSALKTTSSKLEDEAAKPKLSAWKFFWRSFFGTNDPQVA